MTNVIPITLKPELKDYWKYWNLGSHPFFQKTKPIDTAQLQAWHHNAEKASFEQLRAAISSEVGGRWVPEGNYVKLLIKQKDVHFDSDGELIWQTVMSDTPDEMNDHIEPILKAHGRVLIHGLGLGCVLNCMLHNTHVSEIDVVEVNQGVIDLVSPFYRGEALALGKTLRIRHGSCVDIKWPRGQRWNYVWHDIWSTISASNLRDKDDPEHGISYERLHRMFGNRCDEQSSWAFDKAKQMREVEKLSAQFCIRWTRTWNQSTYNDRFEMLIQATCPVMTDVDIYRKFITDEITSKLTGGDSIRKAYITRSKKDMNPIEAGMILDNRVRLWAQQKVGMVAS